MRFYLNEVFSCLKILFVLQKHIEPYGTFVGGNHTNE
jgi:hypothetical protein